MLSKLELVLYKPGDKVIVQNQDVLMADGVTFKPEANVYMVLCGKYRAQTMMQIPENRRNDEQKEIMQLHDGETKFNYLKVGTLFGELSFMYKCKRSATIVSD
jgi:hypothetical protein